MKNIIVLESTFSQQASDWSLHHVPATTIRVKLQVFLLFIVQQKADCTSAFQSVIMFKYASAYLLRGARCSLNMQIFLAKHSDSGGKEQYGSNE